MSDKSGGNHHRTIAISAIGGITGTAPLSSDVIGPRTASRVGSVASARSVLSPDSEPVRGVAPSRSGRRRRVAGLASLTVAAVLLVACGTPSTLVTSERADQIQSVDSPDPSTTTTTTTPDQTTTTVPDRNTPLEPIDPEDPMGDPDVPEVDPAVVDPDAIDFGDNKPPRDYDQFLLASLSDIDTWLHEEFPPVFGQEYESLSGGIHAGYPERTDPLPGCGEPSTSYPDLQQFVAFYCPLGDFMVYDDGPDGLLAQLATEFGPATIGIVLAHEYGHAIQSRVGTLQLGLPTVTTEQQADCVAGAWAGRAASGNAPGITFTDDDIRAGLISMITVQDPVGLDPTGPGGHGSGFDRVGAFQTGFQEGLTRCAQLIDDPLPLTPLQFLSQDDVANEGNAPFGFQPDELFGFLVPDLNLLYDNDLQTMFPDFTPLTLVPVQSIDEVDCDSPFGFFDLGVELCSATNTAYLNEPVARERYDAFGDFSIGYLLGVVWAEHAQVTSNSALRGEERQLYNDCLVGGWVQTVTPDETGNVPEPRDPGRNASISPNDLTEAIQTAIVIGDPSSTTDVLGTAFDKIEEFRTGALGGFAACG